jgi:hypothetical protein
MIYTGFNLGYNNLMDGKKSELDQKWSGLMIVSGSCRELEHDNGALGSAEAKALWRQRQSKQNQIAHAGTEFLKEHGATWDGRKKGRKISGL